MPELVVFLNKVDLLAKGDEDLKELVEMEVRERFSGLTCAVATRGVWMGCLCGFISCLGEGDEEPEPSLKQVQTEERERKQDCLLWRIVLL